MSRSDTPTDLREFLTRLLSPSLPHRRRLGWSLLLVVLGLVLAHVVYWLWYFPDTRDPYMSIPVTAFMAVCVVGNSGVLLTLLTAWFGVTDSLVELSTRVFARIRESSAVSKALAACVAMLTVGTVLYVGCAPWSSAQEKLWLAATSAWLIVFATLTYRSAVFHHSVRAARKWCRVQSVSNLLVASAGVLAIAWIARVKILMSPLDTLSPQELVPVRGHIREQVRLVSVELGGWFLVLFVSGVVGLVISGVVMSRIMKRGEPSLDV